MKKLHLFIFLAILAAIFFGYSYRAAAYDELNTLKLIPQPERFSELYLNDSTKLPHFILKGDTVNFSFTLHNLEGQTTIYPYTVSMRLSDGTTIMIDQQAISLEDQASTTIHEAYQFKSTPQEPVTIFIELTDRNQQLHFVLPSRE